MAILNYSTSIAVDRTLGEVSRALAKAGAASVSTHYDGAGRASGLAFGLRTPHGERRFSLAVNINGVWALLKADPKARSRGPSFTTREHAERVAWRVVAEWLEAQLALIAADMATLDQVMLPYLVVEADGTTLYEAYHEREQAALEA